MSTDRDLKGDIVVFMDSPHDMPRILPRLGFLWLLEYDQHSYPQLLKESVQIAMNHWRGGY